MQLPTRAVAGPASLICIVFLISTAVADPHSQFDYRTHHDHAAAKFNVGPSRPHEAPRLRERHAFDHLQQQPERWVQYVPENSGSIAAEISEARRAAREAEVMRVEEEQREERERGEQRAERAEQDVKEQPRRPTGTKTSRKETNSAPTSNLQRAAKNVKAASAKAGRRARAKVEEFLDLDEDEDESDDDEEEETDQVPRRRRRRRRTAESQAFGTRLWSAIRWVLAMCYLASSWSGHHLLWVPMTYAGEAIRWSAHTSWTTTRWTGERAILTPALTAGAPLIYLMEGLLFIFVWAPARVISIIAREVYPIYIYLGAALAVGTAMGIASAIILYLGSFILSDNSTIEENFSRRADLIPGDLQRRFQQRTKVSPAKKWASGGESIIDRAIKESLERDRQKDPRQAFIAPGQEGASVESDEEDDYFGQHAARFKDIKNATPDYPDVITPTGMVAARRTPTHFGPPSVPSGTAGQASWTASRTDPASNLPALSPTNVRSNTPNFSPYAFTSARSKSLMSPLTSPDIIRSGSSRQRRGINKTL